MKSFLTIGILLFLLMPLVNATCTVTFDSDNYVNGEIVNARMICTGAEEKSDAYTLSWINASGFVIETDTGTTPDTANTDFFETYVLPEDYNTTHGNNITANLTGTQLEGSYTAIVSSSSSSNLILTNFSKTPDYFIGKEGSVRFKASIGGHPIVNARCIVDIVDGNNLPVLVSPLNPLPTQGDGYLLTSHKITDEWATGGEQYKWDIACSCYDSDNTVSDGQMGHCYDASTGLPVSEFATGNAQYPFTIKDLGEKMIVVESFNETLSEGIWVENEDGIRVNMTANLSTLWQEEIDWDVYNNSEDGKAFLTAGERFRVCAYFNNTFDRDSHVYLNSVKLNRNPGTQVTPYCIDRTVCSEEKKVLYIEVDNGAKQQKCSDWMFVPLEIKGQNNWKVVFHMGVEGYKQEVELGSDRFSIFGEERNNDYTEIVEIKNITTNKYNNNISSLAQIQVNFTYDYWQGEEEDFIAKYCFENTDEDIIGGCIERTINPDYGQNNVISDYMYLPYFKDNGAGKVTIKMFGYSDFTQRQENLGFGDFEPQNTFNIRNFQITNLSTSAYGGSVTACDNINVTTTYEFWGSEDNEFIAKYCFEQTDDDYVGKCIEKRIDPDQGEDNTILTTLKVPYFERSGEAEVEIWIYDRDPHGIDTFLFHLDPEPDNTFNITADTSDSCKYSEDLYQEIDLRSAQALEGIENKTGTFHLGIDCPTTGTRGNDMSCIITAYIEDPQTVQKEVDFTCYIYDGTYQYSSINFNQMITRNALSISRSFTVPASFNSGTQYTVQCYADYYNLGSRRDSFYDTFTAISDSYGGSGIRSQSEPDNEPKKPGITGEIVSDEEGKDLKDLLDAFNPLSPKRDTISIIALIIVIFSIILLICLKIERKKNQNYFKYRRSKLRWKRNLSKVGIVLVVLIVLSGLIFGIYHGVKYLNGSPEKVQETKEELEYSPQFSLLQDSLFRNMVLVLFIVLMVILLFKSLHLRGEIRFGDTYQVRRFHEDRKAEQMQKKLNQRIINDELKKQSLKEDYKVRKMSPKEFAEFVKRKI